MISCQSVDNRKSIFSESDEVDFYRVKEESENLLDKDSIWEEKVFTKLLFENEPTGLTNFKEIPYLEQYYHKIPLSAVSAEKITEIFNDAGFPINKASFSLSSICITVYRDILVFKKEGKVTAYAKICLSCYKNYVVLENNNFEDFQINYEDLHKLLDNLANQK